MSEEAGAVVLLAGPKYLTLGTVPEPDSLAIERVEKIPTSFIQGDLQTGDSIQTPITYRTTQDGDAYPAPLKATHYPVEESVGAWQTWAEEADGAFHQMRQMASERDINPGANPSSQTLIKALAEAEVDPPAGDVVIYSDTEEVSYSLMELSEGIHEAQGSAAEEALEVLESQVEKFQERAEVYQGYLETQRADGDGRFDTVQEVADHHGISWRTVHRYVNYVEEMTA